MAIRSTILISVDSENGKIYGALGVIPTNDEEIIDTFSTMIRTIPCEIDILSDHLNRYLCDNFKYRYHIGVGINLRTAGILAEVHGIPVFRMKQFYRLNNNIVKYEIADIVNKIISPINATEDIYYYEVNNYDEFDAAISEDVLKKCRPYKNKRYYKKRFFEHPYYSYRTWIIKDSKGNVGTLSGREVEVNNSKVFRFMNYGGNDELLMMLGRLSEDLFTETNYEYADFYCYGVDETILVNAGMIERVENDNNIIPNYFEPFERKNVEIYCDCKKVDEGIHVYKSDSDQDRPNILRSH